MMACHKYMTYARMLSATMPALQDRGWGRDLLELAFQFDLSQFAGHNYGPVVKVEDCICSVCSFIEKSVQKSCARQTTYI
jgi:hypothetical protein